MHDGQSFLHDGKLSNRVLHILNRNIYCSASHDADAKANQLFSLTAHTENFRKQLTPHSSTKHSASEDLPLSNAGKRVLAYSAEEAERLASKPIGTEHLLLGLLREKKSDVPAALAAAGIDLHSARNRIREQSGLPTLDRETLPNLDSETEDSETGDKDIPLKSLWPFAAFVLLILVLLLLYAIFSLVLR